MTTIDSNRVQKTQVRHASTQIWLITKICLCQMGKYLIRFRQGRKTNVRAEQVSSRRGRVCQGVQVDTA